MRAIVRWKCPPSLWLRVGNRGARAYHRSAASRERCLSMTTRTTSEMVSVSVAGGAEGGRGESLAYLLPFKKPSAVELAWKIFRTAYTFCFKASILNMIAARAIAAAQAAAPQSDEVSWTCTILAIFPAISIVSIIFAQAEFTTREWIYYRMLEHNVIIDFPSRNEHWLCSLWNSAAALWILGGTVLLLVVMGYNACRTGFAFPWTGMLNVATQAYLMISAVHEIRQMSKRLPNINTLIQTNNRENTLAWIAQLEVMLENTVQFHFLCVSEAANAAASGRGSISDVPNGASLSNSIDFSKVGKEGFTAETWKLRRANRGGRDLCSRACTFFTGSQWACRALPTFYLAKADFQVVKNIQYTTRLCCSVSFFVLAMGVTSVGELWNGFTQGNFGNTTMAS